MRAYALQILPDDDDHGKFRWVILESTDDPFRFVGHSAAGCGFDAYLEALDAGTRALAMAEGQACLLGESGDPRRHAEDQLYDSV